MPGTDAATVVPWADRPRLAAAGATGAMCPRDSVASIKVSDELELR